MQEIRKKHADPLKSWKNNARETCMHILQINLNVALVREIWVASIFYPYTWIDLRIIYM